MCAFPSRAVSIQSKSPTSRPFQNGRKTCSRYLASRYGNLPRPFSRVGIVCRRTNLVNSDFENRKEEITRQLVDAAENTGFFTLVDHALSVEEIEAQFAISKSFFALPSEVKQKTTHDPKTALGYENKASGPFTLCSCVHPTNERQ